MRQLIGLLILVAVFLGIKEMHSYWEQVRARKRAEGYRDAGAAELSTPPPQAAASELMPGLPAHLESSLEAARRQGADGLKVWLRQNRRLVQDPRLAAIELDYVIMVAGKNFGEAREIFAAVRDRTPTNSPLHPRIQRLEKNYR